MPNQFVQERSKVKSILQQEEGMTADPEGPDPTDTRDDLQRLDKGKSIISDTNKSSAAGSSSGQ